MSSTGTTIPCEEWKALTRLAFLTVLLLVVLKIPTFVVASKVGRYFGAAHLDGFQLASNVCNLFTLSLVQGVTKACDTFGPPAFGAGNFREVGIVAMRGIVVCFLVVTPPCILLILYMQEGLIWIGIDAEVAEYAQLWYNIFAISLPFYILFFVVWKFLSAQSIVMPLLLSNIASCAVIFPLALYFFEGVAKQWIGNDFLGLALSLVVFQIGLVLLVLLYIAILRPHKAETWPGIHVWKEAFLWEPLKHFIYLAFGGIVVLSEWLFLEVLALSVGTLGVNPMSVHAISTQVFVLWFPIANAVGVSLGVRVGDTLPRNAAISKKLAFITIAISTTVFGLASLLLYKYRHSIYSIFIVDNPELIQGCDEIWISFCLFVWQESIMAVNRGVAVALGLQWTLGVATFFFLWVLGLPALIYFGIYAAHSLPVVWTFVYPPYMCINAVLWVSLYFTHWEGVAENIRLRESSKSNGVTTTDQSDELI